MSPEPLMFLSKLSYPVSQNRERRGACRYPAAIQKVLLGWNVDGSTRQEAAKLVNISYGGCMLSTRGKLPNSPGLPVCLTIETENGSKVVAGELIALRRRFYGVRYIRIRFHESLTFELYKYLVYGGEEPGGRIDEIPDHEKDFYWR